MFFKFGDDTPTMEVKNAKKVCDKCDSQIVIVNGEEVCLCDAECHTAEKAIDFFYTKRSNNE